jgi:UDP-N-acetylglucosamine--N-acetylmuramyl-(pentapeptide) pyrophosphoryl-undecaprenol N-acetylglucosamine transferase
MRGPAVQSIIIAAGGTAGHFFPAEALATELVTRGHRVALMTDGRSGSLTSGIFAGREQYVLSGAGIAGRGVLRGAKAVAALGVGVVQARGILARLEPASVVGFGGYPSVAPVLASRLMRRRPSVILHEQNAVLGRANRFLASSADVLALSFATTELARGRLPTVVTGNPVRPAIGALAQINYMPPGNRIRLLVLGGSLGARVFSDVVPAALKSLPEGLRGRVAVIQQCRAEDLLRVQQAYANFGISAELSSFFPDVAERLGAAHLVIARAGASTLAELAVAGRPAILVPLPGAIDDHQSANARALAGAGGAWIMPQSSFNPESLAERLTGLFADPAALTAAAASARSLGRADAAQRLADAVESRLRQDTVRPGTVRHDTVRPGDGT